MSESFSDGGQAGTENKSDKKPGARTKTGSTGPIFAIGLNKCGTSSLHQLFLRSGIASAHYAVDGENIAVRMMNNIALGMRALEGFGGFQAFSDLTYLDTTVQIEGSRFFRRIHRDYPNGYFILNTRDVDRWIDSRAGHISVVSGLSFLERSEEMSGLSEKEIKSHWRAVFIQHADEVREYFKDYSRFLEFNIEKDDPQILADFLAPSYELDTSEWGKHNSKGHRDKIHKQPSPEWLKRKIKTTVRKWYN